MLKNTIVIAILFIGISCAAVDSVNIIMSMQSEDYGLIRNIVHGDINGDSIADIALIKSRPTDSGISPEINIYLGGNNFDLVPEFTFLTSSFDLTLDMSGDINGDGSDDLIIADPVTSHNGIFDGSIKVFYGGTNLDTIPDLILNGSDYSNLINLTRFGYDFCCEDFNSDGYDDLIVHSPMGGNSYSGLVNIFYGSENPDTVCDWSKLGSGYDHYGLITVISDLTGDGYPEIILSRFIRNISPDNYLYYELEFDVFRGGTTLTNVPQTVIRFPQDNHTLKGCINAEKDFNNDGRNDILLTGTGVDSLFCIFGSDSLNMDFTFFRDLENGVMDLSAIRFEDIDSDNNDDIVLYRENSPNVFQYDIHCNMDWTGSPDLVLPPASITEYYYYEGVKGDLNNDGLNDLVEVHTAADNRALHVEMNIFNVINVQSEDSNVRPYQGYQARNYPNPFNPSTTIEYSLPERGEVEVSIYNIRGQKVKQLVKEEKEPGTHTIIWNGTDSKSKNVGSGVYFYKVKTENSLQVNKMIMLK